MEISTRTEARRGEKTIDRYLFSMLRLRLDLKTESRWWTVDRTLVGGDWREKVDKEGARTGQ